MAFFKDDKSTQGPYTDPAADDGSATGAGVQPPVFTGTTTREQAAPPTGGSTDPSSGGANSSPPPTSAAGGTPGSAAPATAATHGAAPPRWTNLVDFLGAQSGTQASSVANKATAGAQKATTQATQQTQAASGGVNSDAAAGVSHGSVTQTSGGGPLAAPTYDLSKVNLAGYSGPDSAAVANKFTGAQAAGVNAAQQASALKTGHTQGSAYDNALLTQTPNWSKVLGAVSGANQAAQNATAGSQGAQEAVAAAQRASGANVADQKAQLGDASVAIGKSAGAIQAHVQAYADGLSSGDSKTQIDTLNKLTSDPTAMKALGLNTNSLLALRDGVRSGQIAPAQASAYLKSYADAAKGNTGYTQGSADQATQIAKLLNPAAAGVTASTGGSGLTGQALAKDEAGNTHVVSQAKQAVADIQKANRDRGGWFVDHESLIPPGAYTGDPKNAPPAVGQLATAIGTLQKAGYTPDQIASLVGIPLGSVNSLEQTNVGK